MTLKRSILAAAAAPALIAMVAFATGCQNAATSDEHAEADHDHADHDHADHDHADAGHVHTHGAWWCDEHGVPEKICALCDSKLAAEFQRKGDWCAKHDRPDSQCFACHPELEARFAAQYEAKYGKKPPAPQDVAANPSGERSLE
jgi:hypothetical protein